MIITGENLSIYDVYKIAVAGESVELDKTSLNKVSQCYERVQEWGDAEHPIYGVNTGFGELVCMIVPSQYKSDLQRHLLRSHAAGGGENFSDEIVRAIMVTRLNSLMKGYSGTSLQAVELLQQFLNRRLHPLIPQQGSVGASGDLAPLAHMAITLIGDGYLRVNGQVRKAAEVLQEQNLEPLELGYKEALALINGTSAMTGTACIALVRAYQLLKLAIVATADVVQCLGGSTRAFDASGHILKNHLGQIKIAQVLRHLLLDSHLTREHSDIMRAITAQRTGHHEDVFEGTIYLQNAYSLRAIPHILGPVLDTLDFCRKMIEEEVNSCNDNPLFFDTPEETFHSAHFHGQYVAMCCDFMNIALTEIGVLAERQLNRLLDPHLNGNLPPFLASGNSGLFCGFMGGQYLATSIASENLGLAAPASINSIPSNGGNQDVVSMGLIAARKSLQLCENMSTMLAVHVTACNQAAYFLEREQFSPPIQQLHQKLDTIVSEYRDDVVLAEVIARVRAFLTSEQGWQYLDAQVDFD